MKTVLEKCQNEMEINDGPQWELAIAIRAKDFPTILLCLTDIVGHIRTAKIEHIDSVNASCTNNGFHSRTSTHISMPQVAKIKELRRQADELEKELNKDGIP